MKYLHATPHYLLTLSVEDFFFGAGMDCSRGKQDNRGAHALVRKSCDAKGQ